MIDRRALAPTPSHNWGELVEGRPDVGDTTVASWAQWQQMLRQKGRLDGEITLFHQHCLDLLNTYDFLMWLPHKCTVSRWARGRVEASDGVFHFRVASAQRLLALTFVGAFDLEIKLRTAIFSRKHVCIDRYLFVLITCTNA